MSRQSPLDIIPGPLGIIIAVSFFMGMFGDDEETKQEIDVLEDNIGMIVKVVQSDNERLEQIIKYIDIHDSTRPWIEGYERIDSATMSLAYGDDVLKAGSSYVVAYMTNRDWGEGDDGAAPDSMQVGIYAWDSEKEEPGRLVAVFSPETRVIRPYSYAYKYWEERELSNYWKDKK